VRIGVPGFFVICPYSQIETQRQSPLFYSPESLIHLLRANDKPRNFSGVGLRDKLSGT
jgi:hypothetical protein